MEASDTTHSTLLPLCVRLCVDSWDETYIRCHRPDNPIGLLLRYARDPEGMDWSYLRPLLSKGCRLNAVAPRLQDGAMEAELLILEPDYLVDVSAVARCFESYAESGTVHLLHRLQPAANSEAIVLGHLASQMLDEVVHAEGRERSYADSLRDFFHSNALQIATTDIGPHFHTEARTQLLHIAQAVGHQLPQRVQGFRREEVMLEPSFFCETLGLQGRMDFLTADLSLVLEQKSGRGAFVPGDRHTDTPVGRTEHYAQLLLYMLLLRYGNLNGHVPESPHGTTANGTLKAFLLYSHYAQGLLELHFEPRLAFRAIRLRNLIAHMDLRCADGKGFDLLPTLTADAMNERGVQGKLWTNYQRPQLERLLQPIREASPLEQAYYLRMLRFTALEHKLSKLGVPGQPGSGFAMKWHETLEEKRQTGNIYDNLTLVSPDASAQGKVTDVRLRFGCKEDDTSNFRQGDIVVLYPYSANEEPDVRKTVVFRATIAEIEAEGLALHLRAAQADARILRYQQDKRWAVEHDFFESSYNAHYQGLHAFLSAPKERRDLLLLQRKPRTDSKRTLRGDYGAFNQLALRARQARDLLLIVGPPGTGKTSFGLMCCLHEELKDEASRVLLMAFTNRAVDEICDKLLQAELPFVRVGNRLTCAPPYHGHLLEEVMHACTNVEMLRQRIAEARIVVGTTAALSANQAITKLRSFSLAIIDEASQLLEPHLLGLLSAHTDGRPDIRRFILIGDHKQLPAVVAQSPQQSAVTEQALKEIGLSDCRRSLFERLLERYAHDPHITFQLTRQGRMHREIAAFPNLMFYGNTLEEATKRQCQPLEKTDALFSRRLVFIDAPLPTEMAADKVNTAEAHIIASIVAAIHRREASSFSAERTVGVIVPYRNQIAAIRSAIRTYGITALEDITIDTVERYQGSQRRYIVYGFTVHRESQLEFLTASTFRDWDGTLVDRKLNVAMTRAEEFLFLVGNAELLSHVELFGSLIQYCRTEECGRSESAGHAIRSLQLDIADTIKSG